MKGLRERFGRPLRLALIGGGPSTWIGRMHQTAAELDGHWRVVGGVFSSDPTRSRQAGTELGFDPARSYGTLNELITAEKSRTDGVDAVAIMTPNDTHYPYAAAALDGKARLFAIAHGYSAYPMTRYARELVREGALGALRLVQVEYIQSGLATKVEDAPQNNRLRWLLDPRRSGLALVMSAIGCHAQHLACFAAGRNAARVCADVRALMPGRQLIDYVSALFELDGGARGTFTVTQAAAGGENDIRLRVYGEKGMLDWSHREPSYLKLALQGEPVRVIGRGDPFLSPEIVAAGRAPRGHPEGLREAFANVYVELAQERMARALGEAAPASPYPRIEDGAHTMAFIEACIASQQSGGWVNVARLPAS